MAVLHITFLPRAPRGFTCPQCMNTVRKGEPYALFRLETPKEPEDYAVCRACGEAWATQSPEIPSTRQEI